MTIKKILFTLLAGIPFTNLCAEKLSGSSVTVITAAVDAVQVIRISSDTIVLVKGSTFRFTTDTPEDKGRVSTSPGFIELISQLRASDGSKQQYLLLDKFGNTKKDSIVETGDQLKVIAEDGISARRYYINLMPAALNGRLELQQFAITANTKKDIKLFYTAGQRSPDAIVHIYIPSGINVTMNNTTVNVIGRGAVPLGGLATQSIGRTGTHYSYLKVGEVNIKKSADGSSVITFSHLDLRPANGADLVICIQDVTLPRVGTYLFRSDYKITQPEVLSSAGAAPETASLTVVNTIADFERVIDRNMQHKETADLYRTVRFKWGLKNVTVQLQQSLNEGATWTTTNAVANLKNATAEITGLLTDRFYRFRLMVTEGINKGVSNTISFYSGKLDIKKIEGITADGKSDNTESINHAIDLLAKTGGGTLLFSDGVYNARTIHLKSNVYLYLQRGATIRAIKGGDAPETTWFSDKKYRSGLSPTDVGPYEDPENWLTKQDVGHHYFRNSLFFGERLDNVKIIGNGLITGNGNVVTGDNVMKNAPDNRTDKLITCKLCTNLEIGGIYHKEDLWYDSTKDEPYYITKDGGKLFDSANMLQIDRSGHFALLSTGTDNIYVHDTYFGKNNQSSVRDIYDFMGSNNVTVTNIYCKVSSDDIIKPGSDCSLGFTRPARNYKVRNIIGDTNCNLFQIGSETADDIMQVCVDNIYVLGANKAGFSISTNDGAHIKDIHLNCGETGPIHSRSKMFRCTAPFFISISNRGRIIGADVGKYAFTENGVKHDELLVKNVNIGQVENIILNGIDISEVYSGSSFSSKERWKKYDGTQRRATSIIAGYALPVSASVTGGLDFRLPDGRHTGYIKNVSFKDVHIIDKGGNPIADTAAAPPELGVGQYNVSNLKTQPSFGLWARHVAGFKVKDCSFRYEKKDGRYVFFLEDVMDADISSVKAVMPADGVKPVGEKNTSGVKLSGIVYYKDVWGKDPQIFPIGKK
ncbi:MAG: endopygalactorunase [Chitinophaga sp.]|jgi:polygalacturonase|nr:endopygalactorunase [Chitinophaga sp.]